MEEAKFSNDFDYINNCGHLCPLECQSTSYRIIETEFKWSDFDASYFSNFINILDKNPNLDKKLDLKNLTAQQLSENMLGLVFYYDSLRYTQISQSPKTSLSVLVSNLGGSFGLFLDLSFVSVCRAVVFILELIFKIWCEFVRTLKKINYIFSLNCTKSENVFENSYFCFCSLNIFMLLAF